MSGSRRTQSAALGVRDSLAERMALPTAVKIEHLCDNHRTVVARQVLDVRVLPEEVVVGSARNLRLVVICGHGGESSRITPVTQYLRLILCAGQQRQGRCVRTDVAVALRCLARNLEAWTTTQPQTNLPTTSWTKSPAGLVGAAYPSRSTHPMRSERICLRPAKPSTASTPGIAVAKRHSTSMPRCTRTRALLSCCVLQTPSKRRCVAYWTRGHNRWWHRHQPVCAAWREPSETARDGSVGRPVLFCTR